MTIEGAAVEAAPSFHADACSQFQSRVARFAAALLPRARCSARAPAAVAADAARRPGAVIAAQRQSRRPGHPAGAGEHRRSGRALHRLPRPPLRRLAPDAARDARRASPRRRDTTQIFRVAGPLAEPEPLTDSAEPGVARPATSRSTATTSSSSAPAAATRRRSSTASTSRRGRRRCSPSAGERNDLQGWLHRSGQLLYLSVPLDRTARGGTREEIAPDALADRPAAAAGASPPRRASGRRLGGRRGVVGRQARSR